MDGREFDRDHEGHWGWHTADLVTALPGLLETYTPDVVLLHIGTNDAQVGVPTADSAANVAEIVELLRDENPSVAVLVARIIPAADAAMNSRIDDLNAELDALVPTIDDDAARVLLVDMNTAFDLAALANDGLHPNAAGEQVLAERWLAALDLLD